MSLVRVALRSFMILPAVGCQAQVDHLLGEENGGISCRKNHASTMFTICFYPDILFSSHGAKLSR